jgi:hypothetical protein
MHVHFHVHGKGTTYFGDGMAIWYARDPVLEGKADSTLVDATDH